MSDSTLLCDRCSGPAPVGESVEFDQQDEPAWLCQDCLDETGVPLSHY